MKTKGFVMNTRARGIEWRLPTQVNKRESRLLASYARQYGHLLTQDISHGWLTLAKVMIQRNSDCDGVVNAAVDLEGIFYGIMRRQRGGCVIEGKVWKSAYLDSLASR